MTADPDVPAETRLFDVILAAVEAPASEDDVTANGVIAALIDNRPLVAEWLGTITTATRLPQIGSAVIALREIARWFGPGNNQARVIACQALGVDPRDRQEWDDPTAPASSRIEIEALYARVLLRASHGATVEPGLLRMAQQTVETALPRCGAKAPTVEDEPNGWRMPELRCSRFPHDDTTRHSVEVEFERGGGFRLEWA